MTSNKHNSEDPVAKAFAEHLRSLRAKARRAGAHDDEDVVQDAFVRLVERSRRRKLHTLDKLLAHIVRYLAIDRIRVHSTRATYVRSQAGETGLDAAADPERALMSAQRLERVLAAIEAMPPRRREVFLLHRMEELTYAQIARQMGVSSKAVEKHMSLAMRQLSDTDD